MVMDAQYKWPRRVNERNVEKSVATSAEGRITLNITNKAIFTGVGDHISVAADGFPTGTPD